MNVNMLWKKIRQKSVINNELNLDSSDDDSDETEETGKTNKTDESDEEST